jgi:hypothetical protein
LAIGFPPSSGMSSTDGSVHLSADEAKELNRMLSDCRHNVNNCLSLILSAMELAELKPDSAPKMIKTAVDQSKKISEEILRYSADFERVLGAAKMRG